MLLLGHYYCSGRPSPHKSQISSHGAPFCGSNKTAQDVDGVINEVAKNGGGQPHRRRYHAHATQTPHGRLETLYYHHHHLLLLLLLLVAQNPHVRPRDCLRACLSLAVLGVGFLLTLYVRETRSCAFYTKGLRGSLYGWVHTSVNLAVADGGGEEGGEGRG